MKHLLIMPLLLAVISLQAQDLGERIKNRVKRKVENKIDRTVDKTMDKVLDPQPKTAKGKTGQPAEENTAATTAAGENAAGESTVTVSSDFDFIPGDAVIWFDDLAADNTGDFPAHWNTNGSGEVVTLKGHPGRWLKVPDNTITFPEGLKLPEHFTIEFDLSYPAGNTRPPITFGFSETTDPVKQKLGSKKLFYFLLHNAKDLVGYSTSLYSGRETSKSYPLAAHASKPVHVSISVNKSRIRLYMNEDKVFDLPRAFGPATLRSNFHFRAAPVIPAKQPFYIANLRIAKAGTDVRSQLEKTGRYVTSGIYFGVNSASIKPASYNIIKDIATALQENGGMRIRITGHTDADGADAANKTLSEQRAEAVKKMLEEQFNIAASRMETAGKGESEPIAANDDAEGKAANRRVEFEKL